MHLGRLDTPSSLHCVPRTSSNWAKLTPQQREESEGGSKDSLATSEAFSPAPPEMAPGKFTSSEVARQPSPGSRGGQRARQARKAQELPAFGVRLNLALIFSTRARRPSFILFQNAPVVVMQAFLPHDPGFPGELLDKSPCRSHTLFLPANPHQGMGQPEHGNMWGCLAPALGPQNSGFLESETVPSSSAPLPHLPSSVSSASEALHHLHPSHDFLEVFGARL